jgi:hypothetical protein
MKIVKIVKKYTALFCIILLFSTCNDKDVNNCMQTTGTIISKEFLVDSFDKIIVNNGVELFIKESSEQKIVVETGKNLLSDIILTVSDNQLEITDNNDCNFFRDYGVTKVYIYVSNITRIRNSSTYPVNSIGILNFDTLQLISENYLSDYLNFGDFNLEVNSQTVNIIANGPSNHTIKGFSNKINIYFAGNDPRFNGEDLLVKNAQLFARSTNDILIKASEKVSGNLYSTGDVILLKKPLTINLKAYFTGKVINRY